VGGPRELPVLWKPSPWRVVRGPAGEPRVVDEDGFDVLKHPDPVVRLFAHHLTAQAPALEAALRNLSARLFRMRLDRLGDYRDSARVSWAEIELTRCIPPMDEWREAAADQQRMWFDEAA
jgi:hypothetical protein